MENNLNNLEQKCKYQIICPEKTEICKPKSCKLYLLLEENITEKELTNTILEKLYIEDMQDF